jgi:prepilin-type N-terminal cleavage/methylation domain-containing protein
MSRFSNRPRSQGFTLLEVLIAMAILVIGVSAMAALAAVMLTRGRQSRYINVAETLASEKLEDLNHWSTRDPELCVQAGDTSEGSLSTAVTKTITCPGLGVANTINYFDSVSIDFNNGTSCPNPSNGCFAESVANGAANGNGTQYFTTTHSPSGVIPGTIGGTPVSSTTPPSNMDFQRNWLIEANTPVNGTRRITVLVTMLDQSVQPPVRVQMSLVRQ